MHINAYYIIKNKQFQFQSICRPFVAIQRYVAKTYYYDTISHAACSRADFNEQLNPTIGGNPRGRQAKYKLTSSDQQ